MVVQIIDARNPLLFRCPDLEAYVKEVDERKTNVLLLNKADFLTDQQRYIVINKSLFLKVLVVFYITL